MKEPKRVHEICIRYGRTWDSGIRDEATLERIAWKIQSYVKKRIRVESIVAHLIHDIVKEHPFWDGNHRTAFEISRLVLVMFNYRFTVTPRDAETFMRNVDIKDLSHKDFEKWLMQNVRKLR